MINSANKYGYKLTTLGWGAPWGGLGTKPKLLKKAIESKVITAKHILFVDAFDVVFQRPPEEALEQFLAWSNSPKIIWNAEKNCFPDAKLAKDHPPTDSPFKYLNSGMSIGESEAYLECLTEMKVQDWMDDHRMRNGRMYERNDQDDWMRRFVHGQCGNQCKMVLDSGCELFQTMTGTVLDDFELKDGRVRNKEFNTFPCAIHHNGGAKTSGTMEPILNCLKL